MRVALLEPPATDPRSPHLAMASLAAALALDGVGADVVDAGAEALHWLLEPDRVEGALRQLPHAHDHPAGPFLRRVGPLLVEGAADAVATLRHPERFYDAGACDEAREVIAKTLLAHSVANGHHSCSIAPLRYDVAGVGPGRLEDLASVTAAPEHGLFGEYFSGLADRLDRQRPAFVALSILNHQQIVPGLTLARLLRNRGHAVVLGGTVYAKFSDALRARPAFFELFCDAVCVYEGDTAIRALAAAAADGAAHGTPLRFDGVPNVLWLDRAHGEVRSGPVHSEDVARLPTPDFSGFELGTYLTPEPVLPVLTGKGCYFNRCKFCDIPFINRVAPRPYRRRAPEQVAADLAALWQRYGARHFVVTDEALAPRFLLQIAEALADHPAFEPRLVGYARFEANFTAEVCRDLHRAGVRRLFFGLESGSQRMLDHMDKGVRVDVAHRVVRHCAAAGIGVHLFSMIGLPEEEEVDARETLQFFLDEADVLDHPRHTMDVHRFNLDLRTAYFDDADRYGVVVDRAALNAVDFPLDAPRWELARGLSATDVDRVQTAFFDTLRSRFRRSRAFPAHVYPSFEEYSVLYADRFDTDGGWSLRFALPPEGDPTVCALQWCSRLAVTPVAGGVLVSAATGERALSSGAYGLLMPLPAPAPVSELLDAQVRRLFLDRGDPIATGADGAGLRAELRAIIDDLLAAGVLRLRACGAGATAEHGEPGTDRP